MGNSVVHAASAVAAAGSSTAKFSSVVRRPRMLGPLAMVPPRSVNDDQRAPLVNAAAMFVIGPIARTAPV